MNFKQFALACGLTALSLTLFAVEPAVLIPPDSPVCKENKCPYVISQGPYTASITCTKTHFFSKEYNCKLTASDGSTLSVTQDIKDYFDPHLTSLWLSPTLLEITDNFQQGHSAYFPDRTLFIDFKNLEISPIFFSIYAINLKQMVVLCESAMDLDQTDDKEIYIIPIFNATKSITIARDFQGTFLHSVYAEPMSQFLKNGNLKLVYMNTDRKTITEIIPVNYKQLGITP